MTTSRYKVGGHYICSRCGTEIQIMKEGGANIVCCVKPMKEITPSKENSLAEAKLGDILPKDVFSIAEYTLEKFITKNIFLFSTVQVDAYYFRYGQSQEIHAHPNSEQVLSLLEGKGIFFLGDKEVEVTTGSTMTIPRDMPHGIKNTSAGTMVVLAISTPKL